MTDREDSSDPATIEVVNKARMVPGKDGEDGDTTLEEEGSMAPFLERDLESLVSHGRAAFTRGEYGLALKFFEAALVLDPQNRVGLFFKAKVKFTLRSHRSYDKLADLTHSVERPRYGPSPDFVPCPTCEGGGGCAFCKGKGTCPSCGGSGWRSLLQKECNVCKGTGICDVCNETRRCSTCKGRGVVRKRQVKEVMD